jgi:hypothetical protein
MLQPRAFSLSHLHEFLTTFALCLPVHCDEAVMHEWIPVLCGALLERACGGHLRAASLLIRIVAVAMLVVIATHEWAHLLSALAFDALLVSAGALLTRAAPRLWSLARTRRLSVPISD